MRFSLNRQAAVLADVTCYHGDPTLTANNNVGLEMF